MQDVLEVPNEGGKKQGTRLAGSRTPAAAPPYREHPRPQMNAAQIARLTTVQLARTCQIYFVLFIHTPVWVAL